MLEPAQSVIDVPEDGLADVVNQAVSRKLVRIRDVEAAVRHLEVVGGVRVLVLVAQRPDRHALDHPAARLRVGRDPLAARGRGESAGGGGGRRQNEEINKQILNRAGSFEIKEAAIRGGMTTLADDVRNKMLLGQTSLEEAMRAEGVKKIAFSSTGSVYGEPDLFPLEVGGRPLQW